MIIKGLADEDFVNYKKPSMFIIFNKCDFKCDRENKTKYCYNSPLAHEKDIKISAQAIYERYSINPITSAIICGGLEPFDTPEQLLEFIECVRNTHNCNDDIVIFTGYTEEEIENGNYCNSQQTQNKLYADTIKSHKNIIIKYGRFRPNQAAHTDEILGIKLASPNQYAVAYNLEE